MCSITCFDRAKNMNGRDIATGESAIVHDLFDARTGRGDLARQIGQAARAITNLRREPAEPSVGDQSTLDDATKNVRIDIPPAQEKHTILTREFLELSR